MEKQISLLIQVIVVLRNFVYIFQIVMITRSFRSNECIYQPNHQLSYVCTELLLRATEL